MRCTTLVVLFTLLTLQPAFGWHTNTHLQMTKDAISLMPPDMQKMFTDNNKITEIGVKDPDETLRDWQNHYYLPLDKPEGGAIDRIEKIAKVIEIKHKSGAPIDLVKQYCYIAHYIADIWQPETLIKQPTGTNSDFVLNTDILVFYQGHSAPVENIREYLTHRAAWRWKLETNPKLGSLLYSEAVNDIARVWLTLWEKSGKTVAPQLATSIEHRKGALSINFERLLTDQRMNWYKEYDYNVSWEDNYQDYQSQMKKIQENIDTSEERYAAKAEIRKEEQMLSKLSPDGNFKLVDSSLKTLGEKGYFVARVKNTGPLEILSLAFMVNGVKGPVALVKNLKSGQVTKVEAIVPAGTTKEQIQLIFAHAVEGQPQ